MKFKGEKAKGEMKWKEDTINIHLEGQGREFGVQVKNNNTRS